MARRSGVYRAVVDDDADPTGRGRLRVTVAGQRTGSVWAEACLPPVPAGVFSPPAVGSTVWVQFEEGDRDRPVWTGVSWETSRAASPTITSATSLTLRAPMVHVEAALTEFTGVVTCQSVIADSVVAASYTPGAGNVR